MSGSIPPEDPSIPVVVTPSVNDSIPPVVVSPIPGGYIATTNTMFDVASLNQQIESAIASVPQDKRGCFLVRADLKKATVALMIRAGDNVSFVTRVQKSYAGDGIEADVSGRVTFLFGSGSGPKLMTVMDYYHVFRGVSAAFAPNSRWRAFVKAVGIHYFNLRPYLDGECWWDSHVS